MKFYPAASAAAEEDALKTDLQKAHEIGVMKIGSEFLFFRVRLKTYYIPFSEITRCFRRVRSVPARMCCGRGNMAMESMVICTEAGEAAEIQMPGERAGKAALEELKVKIPHAAFARPAAEGSEA